MNQQETWVMHAIFGAAIAFLTVFAVEMYAIDADHGMGILIFWVGYIVGRERRDHEIKAGLRAAEWYRGWNIFRWGTDGIMDLLTWVTPIFAAVVYLHV